MFAGERVAVLGKHGEILDTGIVVNPAGPLLIVQTDAGNVVSISRAKLARYGR